MAPKRPEGLLETVFVFLAALGLGGSKMLSRSPPGGLELNPDSIHVVNARGSPQTLAPDALTPSHPRTAGPQSGKGEARETHQQPKTSRLQKQAEGTEGTEGNPYEEEAEQQHPRGP